MTYEEYRQTGVCSAHGLKLVKHRRVNGEIIYSCPKEKCSYKEDEDGRAI